MTCESLLKLLISNQLNKIRHHAHPNRSTVRSMKPRHQFEEEYCICGVLGRGKYATVYKCMHKETQHYRAAKIISCDKSRYQCVETEIHILSRSKHDNMVKLYEVFQDTSETVLVLELVSGGELLDVITADNCSITEYDVMCIIKQLCTVLKHLHSRDIVHMDIKPENILLIGNEPSQKPSIKLVDFGLARLLKNARTCDDIGGTPEFFAPEIIEYAGRVITPAIDMWCVGVTTYICLTGYSPFQGDNHKDTCTNIQNLKYYDHEDLFGQYTHDALDFIKKLLVPDGRMKASECLKHPWLKGKKGRKQKCMVGNPVRLNMMSDGVCADPAMSTLKERLESLSVPGDNIKPSTVVGITPSYTYTKS